MDTSQPKQKGARIVGTLSLGPRDGSTQLLVYKGEKSIPLRFGLIGNMIKTDEGPVTVNYRVIIRAIYREKTERDLDLVSESRILSDRFDDRDIRINTYVNRLRKKPPESWYIFLVMESSNPCRIEVSLKPWIRIISSRKIKTRSRNADLRGTRQVRALKYDVDRRITESIEERALIEASGFGTSRRYNKKKWKRIFRIFRFRPMLKTLAVSDYVGSVDVYTCSDLHRIRKISLLISADSRAMASLFSLYLVREGEPAPGEGRKRIIHSKNVEITGGQERYFQCKTKDLVVARGDRFVLICEAIGEFAVSFMAYQSTKMYVPKSLESV